MHLIAAMAVVDAEEMNGGDLGRGFGTGGRTTAHVIACARHEARNHSDGVLHLSPSPNHRSEAPSHSLVVPPDALGPRHRHSQLVSGQERPVHQTRHQQRRNLAGAARRRSRDLSGARGASRVFCGEYRGRARARGRQFEVGE